MAQAYLLYSEAAAMAPNNKTYWLRSQAVRTRAALEASPPPNFAGPAGRRGRAGRRFRFETATPKTGRSRKPLPPTELTPNRVCRIST